MARLVLDNVSKLFAGPRRQTIAALRDLNLTVADGEFVVMVGPSGCGKTTTLRLIAGLEMPDAGTISLDGKSLAAVAPRDRDVAMVFQHHALLPNLTVAENLGFGLMLRRCPRDEITRRVRAAALILNLTAFLERKPPALSGGECQRVALGRALARQPQLFLLDEPLSNLDAPLRLQVRDAIAAVRRRAGAMMLYVTHDQAEAMALADRVAVMKDGALQQAASPMELYRRPINRFVAGVIGSPPMNFFPGVLVRENGSLLFRAAQGDGWTVALAARHAQSLPACVNQSVIMGLRPEHISPADRASRASLAALLERVEPAGAEVLLYFSRACLPFVARVRADGTPRDGESVPVWFDMEQAHFFDPATGQALA